MLDALKKLFRVRTLDLEAKLRPTESCTFGGVGEVEIEVWSDGTAEIEASLEHSGAPDDTRLDVYAAGTKLISLRVMGGYATNVRHTESLEAPPRIAAGDVAELREGEAVLYRGSFHRD